MTFTVPCGTVWSTVFFILIAPAQNTCLLSFNYNIIFTFSPLFQREERVSTAVVVLQYEFDGHYTYIITLVIDTFVQSNLQERDTQTQEHQGHFDM